MEYGRVYWLLFFSLSSYSYLGDGGTDRREILPDGILIGPGQVFSLLGAVPSENPQIRNFGSKFWPSDREYINTDKSKTSSPAVAERPRDALCLSVVSFNSTGVQYVKRNLLSLVTSASDLPLRTNKLCSHLFGVFTDAWRSVP